jgi:hypothetical protein
MDTLISYVRAGLLAGARDARAALALQAVGAAWVALAVLRALWALVLAPLLRAATRRPVRSYGEWAVVTGATDVRAAAGGTALVTLCAQRRVAEVLTRLRLFFTPRPAGYWKGLRL